MKVSKSAVLIVVFAFVALIAGVGLKFYMTYHSGSSGIFKEIEKNTSPDSKEYEALKEQGKFNVLIMGEDNVEGSRRSDTILFAAINIRDRNIRILSLPRDTRVQIPNHGTQKLNHAFAYGGQELMIETVERYLGEPILYYVVVDYDSFPALIDIMGGVEIDVKKKMRYVDRAGKLDINIQPGLQTMDGKTALHFVRFRKDALGDIGRVQRQQQFVKALIKKAYDPSAIIKIPELIGQMAKLFKTDMTPTLAIQLGGFVSNEIGRDRIFFSTLHGQAQTIDRLSYWIGDVDTTKTFLDTSLDILISGDIDAKRTSKNNFAGLSLSYTNALDENPSAAKSKDTSADNKETREPGKAQKHEMTKEDITKIVKSIPDSIAVLNGTGKSGVGQEVAVRLQTLGIDVLDTGNAKHFDYQISNVIYPVNAEAKSLESAKILGNFLEVPKNLVRPSKQAFYASIILGHDYKKIVNLLDKYIAAQKN